MAKAGFSLEFEPYSRRDPVTDVVKTFIRTKHARQTSKRLKEFQKCVRKGMEDYKAPGDTPKERAKNIREKFAEVARSCKS